MWSSSLETRLSMRKVKVEFHTHTNYSDHVNTAFKKIIETCVEKHIDVLVITDHGEVEGAERLAHMAPFRVIIGEEILTSEGEIIGLFLRKKISNGLTFSQTIKEIKKQKGLVYLPHPFDTITRRTSAVQKSINENIDDIDIVEIYNGRTLNPQHNRKAKELAEEFRKITAIGSDAHTHYEYGRNYMIMDDFKNPSEFLKSLKLKFQQIPRKMQ